MDPIQPWLDGAEVRRLAEGLMRPHLVASPSVTDAGFDAGFVGYSALAGPPALPEVAPVPPPTIDAVSPAPAVRGPFLDRISRFCDWLRDQFGATGIFILDREGAVIFDASSHGRLHFLARSLALASRRQGASSGNVHVKISAGSTLEVIPVDTAYGCLVLGAVVAESLSPAAVAAVMDALAKATTAPTER
jgi:hypothetical protein